MLTMDQRRVSLRSALLEKILACRSIKRFFGGAHEGKPE